MRPKFDSAWRVHSGEDYRRQWERYGALDGGSSAAGWGGFPAHSPRPGRAHSQPGGAGRALLRGGGGDGCSPTPPPAPRVYAVVLAHLARLPRRVREISTWLLGECVPPLGHCLP